MRISRRWLSVVGLVATTVALAACTTTVAGAGRPGGPAAAGGGVGASASVRPSTVRGMEVPSGAPAVGTPGYPDSTPQMRSYLFARDATFKVDTITFTGPWTHDGQPVDVTATFGYASNSFASCTYTAGGTTAQVLASADTTVAKGGAGFWTAVGYGADVAAAAADKWVQVTDILSVPGACNNDVYFLSQFEPQDSDTLTTGVDGDDYLLTDTTTGIVTVIDRGNGRIVGIRTSRGTIQVTFPDAAPAAPTLPGAGEIVAVKGV